MQYLHLALRAVTNVKREAVILGIEQTLIVAARILLNIYARHRMAFQFKDIRLNPMQKIIWRNINKRIQLLAVFQFR